MESKLKKLISLCSGEVILMVNAHTSNYESAKEYITELIDCDQIDSNDISKEILDKMIELNTIIDLQFYPDTPVGFYNIYHYDVYLAINMALEILEGKE